MKHECNSTALSFGSATTANSILAVPEVYYIHATCRHSDIL